MSVHLAKAETPMVIHEVNWRLRKEVTREALLRDMQYAEDLHFPVHEWRGEDREGEPMSVRWVATGENGRLLAAYEIQAPAPSPRRR